MKNRLNDYLTHHDKSHIVFDFDKTLCSLSIDWTMWHTNMEQLLRSYESDFIASSIAERVAAQNIFIKKYGEKVRSEMVTINKQHEQKYLVNYMWHEGLLEFVRENDAYALSIWSSNDSSTIIPILEKEGIKNKFKHVVGRDSVTYIKPEADGFELINSTRAPLDSYLMIGDSTADQFAAQKVGIDFMHVEEL